MYKKILSLSALLLLTACSEPATILREETVDMKAVSTEKILLVRGASHWRVDFVGERSSASMNIPVRCELSDTIIGESVKVTKSLDSNGWMSYTFQPSYEEVRAELMMEYCW